MKAIASGAFLGLSGWFAHTHDFGPAVIFFGLFLIPLALECCEYAVELIRSKP